MSIEHGYGYDDVYLIPRYSDILTRKEVSTKVEFGNTFVQVPLISANMNTVSEYQMCIAMRRAGAIGALHRFMPIQENVDQFKKVYDDVFSYASNARACCFVSIGVNNDWKERAQELYKVGARYFIIDIAHGHSKMMKKTVQWMKSNFNDIFLVGGNVATPNAIIDIESWGVDAVKIGVGPGYVCATKDVTGVTVPIFTCILECAKVAKTPIIADGGAKMPGHVAKAIAAGATMVMSGFLFAGCDEVPETARSKSGFVYQGSASESVMKTVRKGELPPAEGIQTMVESKGPVTKIVEEIAGGLRSAYSYMGARTTAEFQNKATFGYKGR